MSLLFGCFTSQLARSGANQQPWTFSFERQINSTETKFHLSCSVRRYEYTDAYLKNDRVTVSRRGFFAHDLTMILGVDKRPIPRHAEQIHHGFVYNSVVDGVILPTVFHTQVVTQSRCASLDIHRFFLLVHLGILWQSSAQKLQLLGWRPGNRKGNGFTSRVRNGHDTWTNTSSNSLE